MAIKNKATKWFNSASTGYEIRTRPTAKPVTRHIAKTAASAEITRRTGEVVCGRFTAILNGTRSNQISARKERIIIGRNVVSP